MSKINGDYKKKYIILEIDDKTDKNILIDALKEHIEKLSQGIEKATKSEYSADVIIRDAHIITKCMKWRDNIEFMGTDTSLRDFDFYKHGIERFY